MNYNPSISSGIILCMCSANERWRYIVMSSLIGWAYTQKVPCILCCNHWTSFFSAFHETRPLWAAKCKISLLSRVIHLCMNQLFYLFPYLFSHSLIHPFIKLYYFLFFFKMCIWAYFYLSSKSHIFWHQWVTFSCKGKIGKGDWY